MALVKITQERSKIRCLEKHKRTLAALGLRRIRHVNSMDVSANVRFLLR